MSYESHRGLGTGSASVMPAPTRREMRPPAPPTPEEQARREYERTFVEDRSEAASQALQQNLRFLNPQSYSGPYGGLGLITLAIALAPAAIAGGIAGARQDGWLKGAAVGTGAAGLTALLLSPAAIMVTGRRNPIRDALTTTRLAGWGPFWLAVAAGGAVGFGAGHLATRADG